MNGKDSMLFPVTDIFDLAETLVNLSDEGLITLKKALSSDYGIRLELHHNKKETTNGAETTRKVDNRQSEQ